MAMNGTDRGERSPLLSGREPEEYSGSEAGTPSPSNSDGPAPTVFPRRDLAIAVLLVLWLVILETSSLMQMVPLNKVLENIICRNLYPEFRHHPDTAEDSGPCRDSKEVQAELAFVRGWQGPLEVIPGLLTAIPYGFLADKYGRKIVLASCAVGSFLGQVWYIVVCRWPNIFPVRLVWLSPAFTLIGGGSVVMSAIIFGMLSDLSPDAYRSNTFLGLGATIIAAELVGAPLTSVLMEKDVWLPIFIGLGMGGFGAIVAFFLPETLGVKAVPGDVPSDLEGEDVEEAASKSISAQLKDGLSSLKTAAIFFIWGQRDIALLLVTLLTTTLGKHAQEILLQFARKQFGWSWAQAAYLISVKAAVGLLLLVVILPGSGYLLMRYASLTPGSKDFVLARVSCLLMFVGTLTIGLSMSSSVMILGLVTYVCGGAYNLLLRSILVAVVEPHHRGTLFATMSLLENLSSVIASPLLAFTFRVGLGWEGVWVGLPFMVASGLFCVALMILYGTRMPASL